MVKELCLKLRSFYTTRDEAGLMLKGNVFYSLGAEYIKLVFKLILGCVYLGINKKVDNNFRSGSDIQVNFIDV